MSKNILSLSLAVILSLSLLSACARDSDSPKIPNGSRGEVREDRYENGETGRGNRDDDTRNTQNQFAPQSVAPVQETTPVPAQTPATITPTPVTPPAPATTDPTPVAPASQAKTVTKTVSYQVPEGSTTNTFTVSIAADGTISSVTSVMKKGDHDSQMFNRIFASSISAQVVGKKPSAVTNLSAVGGASLTTDAFNSFVASI